MATLSPRVLAVCLLAVAAVLVQADDTAEPTGAAWELRALGVDDDGQAQVLRENVRRTVTLAIVGQGGASRSQLAPLLTAGNTFEYRDGAEDPGSSTHDTGMARVILQLTSRLGIQVRLLVYQPGAAFEDVARHLRLAGAEADIVAFYQSFWGSDVTHIKQALRDTGGCLFISPYVEYQSRPTSSCPQALSFRPWGDSLPNLITTVPCAFKAPGRLLTPSMGADDTEIINFVAPSYYASGPGGTCPSATVAAAVAAYIVAAADTRPRPQDVVRLMRETVISDPAMLAEVLSCTDEDASSLASAIAALADPEDNAARKLDAAGLLNLWAIHERLVAAEPE